MEKTVFIGQSFLSRPIGEYWFEYYTFYGAIRVNANIWQLNISKERHGYNSSYANNSTPFCLNLEEGSLLRIPDFFIYIQKDGSVGIRSDYSNEYKGRCSVVSVKIIGIGQDFISVEYTLAK